MSQMYSNALNVSKQEEMTKVERKAEARPVKCEAILQAKLFHRARLRNNNSWIFSNIEENESSRRSADRRRGGLPAGRQASFPRDEMILKMYTAVCSTT